jgi:hypothetical protein
MNKQTIKVEKLATRARLDSKTFDEKAQTIDVVLATETLDVTRYDYRNGNFFIEQLVISPETVRLDRINAGAPFLDSHNSYSVANVLGKVVNGSAVIDGNKIRCKIQLSQREDIAGIINDIRNGILENISVGYKVFKYERQPEIEGQTPVYRVIDWEPYEATSCAVPADIESGVGRSSNTNEKDAREIEVEFVNADGYVSTRSAQQSEIFNNQNKITMNLKERALAVGLNADATETQIVEAERKLALTRRALAVGLAHNASETDIETAERANTEKTQSEATRKAVEAEHSRVSEITKLVRKMSLPVEFSDKLILDKVSLENARALVIDEVAKGDPAIRGNVSVTGKDETVKKREAIVSGLILRSGAIEAKDITKEERETGNEYRSLTLLDLAKNCLEAEQPGSTRGLDKMEIAKRAISSSSSDFPVLLEGTNRRILLNAYTTAPDTWRQFCATGSVSDFRAWKRLRPGSISNLDSLLENQEYKIKKINDASAESITATTKGNIINISRVMIVNDDLQGFTSLAKALGRAANRTIESDVYALLAQNAGLGPNMSDGVALFNAAHNNVAAVAAAPSMAGFDAMKQLVAGQKDRNSNDFIDAKVNIFLGPLSLEGTAKSINGSEYDPDVANKLNKPNIVKNMFSSIIGSPRLSGTRWYAFDSENRVIEVVFLDGQQNPFLESERPFNVDGLSWKVRHDYGVGAIDYVGAGTNAGV